MGSRGLRWGAGMVLRVRLEPDTIPGPGHLSWASAVACPRDDPLADALPPLPPETMPGTFEPSSPAVPTVRALLAEAVRELTNLDSRIWGTLRGLARPGELTRRWLAGKREGTVSPVRLYLVASFAYFLVGPDPVIRSMVAESVAEVVTAGAVEGLTAHGVRTVVEARILGWMSVARIMTILPLAAALALVVPRQRGEGRLVPGAVLAIHMLTVSFLVAVVLTASIWVARVGGVPSLASDLGMAHGWLDATPLYLERGLVAVWLCLAIRRALNRGWVAAVTASLAALLLDTLILLFSFGMVVGLVLELIRP